VARRSELEPLRLRVVEALCGVELHLTAAELDIKLHNMLHLVDAIINAGEAAAAWRRRLAVAACRPCGGLGA
jgi:hypothetical protein